MTVELGLKPPPETVSVNAELPARTRFGEIEERLGSALYNPPLTTVLTVA